MIVVRQKFIAFLCRLVDRQFSVVFNQLIDVEEPEKVSSLSGTEAAACHDLSLSGRCLGLL